MTGKLRAFRRRRLSPEQGRDAAARVLSTPTADREEKAASLHLDDPETLLSVLEQLSRLYERSPVEAVDEAVFLYGYLEKLVVRHPHDPMLYDEREYFLGEAARIAGTSCRFLSRRAEARDWFDLSEAWFLAVENSAACIARLSYQRFALRAEERDFAAVLKLLPHLIGNFERMHMHDDALKARVLQAVALKELGDLRPAVAAFERVVADAEGQRNETVLGSAYVNLAQLLAFMGDLDGALQWSVKATPILQRLGHNVALAQLHLGIAYALRSKHQLQSSIDAYRTAQREFAAIGMHADVAAVHLVLADLLLEIGQSAQAEWEIRAALPIIEEYKLVPEGIAAYALLRDSLRGRQIDRRALRELHGYFRSDQT